MCVEESICGIEMQEMSLNDMTLTVTPPREMSSLVGMGGKEGRMNDRREEGVLLS